MFMQAIAEKLKGQVREVRLRPGEVLFRQGDEARGMLLLKSGAVRLLRHTADGHEVTLHSVMPGESFAEASLFSDVYHCSCISQRDSMVEILPRQAVLRLLREDADAAMLLAAGLAEQVRNLRAQAELRGIHGSTKRLLAALRLHADESGQVRLRGSLKTLAGELGMAHETIYRALATLETSGHLRRMDGKIFLPGSTGNGAAP